MSVPVLLIEPIKDGLARQFKATGTVTETEGGAPRIRKTVIGATSVYSLNFVCTAAEYFYFVSFYEIELEEGNLPFEVQITSDGFGKAPHIGIILPGSLSSPQIVGKTHYFSCQFDGERKEPLTRDFKTAMMLLIPNMKIDLDEYCSAFMQIEYAVNTLFPDASSAD